MEHNPEYMDINTLWNNRRDPHANPLASSPRRMYSRAPSQGNLHGLVEQIYSPSQMDTEAHYPLANERLYGRR